MSQITALYPKLYLQPVIIYISYKAKTANAATTPMTLPVPTAFLPALPVKGVTVAVGTPPAVPLTVPGAVAVPVGYTVVPFTGATVLTTKVVVGVTTVLNEDTVALLVGTVNVVTVTGAAEVMVVRGAAVPVTVLVTVVVPVEAELDMPNWVLYWYVHVVSSTISMP